MAVQLRQPSDRPGVTRVGVVCVEVRRRRILFGGLLNDVLVVIVLIGFAPA